MSGTPSTKNLRAMPDPETLWKRCVSLALAAPWVRIVVASAADTGVGRETKRAWPSTA